MDYRRRLVDLLTKFGWNEVIVEDVCGLFDGIGRYAVVSVNVHDKHEHWIDGFAAELADAATLITTIEEDWKLVGVYDLDGEPGEEIAYVSTRVTYEVGTPDSLGRAVDTLGEDTSDPVGTRDAAWAYKALGVGEDDDAQD